MLVAKVAVTVKVRTLAALRLKPMGLTQVASVRATQTSPTCLGLRLKTLP